jgi:hypothetical protein
MQARFTAEIEITVWIAGPEETKNRPGKSSACFRSVNDPVFTLGKTPGSSQFVTGFKLQKRRKLFIGTLTLPVVTMRVPYRK